ncbi:MAG: IPT/TIG domain-containing protein [Acidobacteria bacterium]|nr:IPT/TIG domain-containing protein [Acidobacteriota bacterium]
MGGSTWVSLGPTNGAGRMTGISPHPTDVGTVLAGAAGGGVWKTTDGGASWVSLTDGLNDLSVGAVAYAPSSPNVVYLGTGEGSYAVDFIPGIGLLKSTDGGATWTLPSSVLASRFHRINVHPTNPNELLVGTSRGALRSTDGGASWETVISPTAYGDVPEILRDPTDPRNLFATTWCISGGCTFKTAHVLKSTDGGATWTDRSFGLPTANPSDFAYERTALALSPSNTSVLYAARSVRPAAGTIISHVYRTVDGGATWTDLPSVSARNSRYLADQSWYNNTIIVSPTDSNTVIAGGTRYLRSTDGGANFTPVLDGEVHVDAHDLRYQGSTLWFANDGGVWTSVDDGISSTDRNNGLVTRQYYALAIDPINRNRILAGAQDNGTNQRMDGGGTVWRPVIGSDGFECVVNPFSPAIAWGSTQQGQIFRSRNVGASTDPSFQSVTPPYDANEETPFLTVLRNDPRAPQTIYTGSYRLWRSRDGGTVWVPLPTTTTDGSAWPRSTTVTSLALSRTDPLLILVGKENGIYRSGDGGQTWTPATGVPDRVLTNLEIDPTNSGIAYATFSAITLPSVYRSVDGGLTWAPSASGLPAFPSQVIRVDPTDSNVVFVGTDVGVFRSPDRGATWSRFGTGLPSSSVHDLQVLDDGSMLRVATHGRGIWELQVPATGNNPPVPTVVAPASSIAVPLGTTVSFSGTVTDPDPGDTASGTWFFPDTSENIPLPGGAGTVAHTFRRAGSFPVALSARDSRGALGTAVVQVSVTDSGDACATPVVIPSNGPFPYAVLASSESATTEATDPSPSCWVSAKAASLWFEYTPPADGQYEISTCGSAPDTVLSVFTGAACGPYTPVSGGCNDDAPASSGCGTQASLVTVTGRAGQTFRIQATGFDESSLGSFALNVRPISVPASSPRVGGVNAGEGPAPGGTTVLITGSGFQNDATVSFGGVAGTDVVVLAPTLLSVRTPAHAPGDVDVSVTSGGGTGTLSRAFAFTPYTPVACAPGDSTLCMNGGRFRAQVVWRVPTQNAAGLASAVALTGDTGYFWFFSSNNIELVVKVVDGRGFNGKFWVFYGALSNVEYTLTVTDIVTGAVRVYTNPSGLLSSVADTSAF